MAGWNLMCLVLLPQKVAASKGQAPLPKLTSQSVLAWLGHVAHKA